MPTAMIIDADHFKTINDTHGHAAGDTVLMALARTIGRQKRESDLYCRFGGEEFALLADTPDAAHGLQAAERLRETIAGLALRHGTTPVSVTVSIGAARWRPGESLAALLERADRALYRAKENGRNRSLLDD